MDVKTTGKKRSIKVSGLLAVAILAILALGALPAEGKKVLVATRHFSFKPSMVNNAQRLTVNCRRGWSPVGGGLVANPAVDGNQIGIYPLASERLGFQGGWHYGATLFNATPIPTAPRDAALQAFCTKVKGRVTPVLSQTLVDPGTSGTAVAHCPPGKTLLSGGFLTNHFAPTWGIYATESRRLDDSSWEAGGFALVGVHSHGGYVTAVAYCLSTKNQILSEVSSTATVSGRGGTATAVTPACPAGHPLTSGGYSGPTNGSLRFFNTYRTAGGNWSVSASGVTGGGTFTAYGYCVIQASGAYGKGPGHGSTVFSAPVVSSTLTQPTSPHGPSFTVQVHGSSYGKLAGSPSNSPQAQACLANRSIVLRPSYRNQTNPQPTPAGPAVTTTTDGSGRFSAAVPVSVPLVAINPGSSKPISLSNEISVHAAFEDYTYRRVGKTKVTCEPGGPLYPAWFPVGL